MFACSSSERPRCVRQAAEAVDDEQQDLRVVGDGELAQEFEIHVVESTNEVRESIASPLGAVRWHHEEMARLFVETAGCFRLTVITHVELRLPENERTWRWLSLV